MSRNPGWMARGTKHHNPAAIPSAPARPNHEARHKPLVGGCPLTSLHGLPSQQAPLLGRLELKERSTELRMPLQWKQTTLYPCLPNSHIHVASCSRRLAPFLPHLPDVPVRLLPAVLSCPVQQQRLLSQALPLRVELVQLQRLRLLVAPLQAVPLLSSVLPLQLCPVPAAVEHVPQV